MNEIKNHTERSSPWRRLWARMFDYLFFILILQVLTRIFPLNLTSLHPYFFIAILFFWIFIETALIKTIKTTPGKWLLSMQVINKQGQGLSFRDSFHRSLSVWWLGLAAGVPIICLISMIVAAVKLSHLRVCSWDKGEGYQVVIGKLRTIKIVFFILILLCYSWFISFNVNYVLSFF